MLARDSNIQFAGGAELQQVIIAKGLVQRGYPVSMVCLDYGQNDVCEIDGITVYRAFHPNEGVPLLRFIWPRLTSIWRCLKRANADIYYHRAGSMLTGVMAAFCQKQGKKSTFAVAGQTEIRFGRDRWLYEYGTKHVDRVVVQNAAQARYVREAMRRDSVLIPNICQAVEHVEASSDQHILWVGMIRQIKRPDIFLDIVRSLPEQRFVMVGGPGVGEALLYEEIRGRAVKLHNLKFVGFVPYSEVGPYFDNAQLFINTSDSEGFPNTFLHAWARGVPTVSFIDSGARMDGQPVGVLVKTANEMSKAITDLLENDVKRSRLAKESKEYVELNHAPDRILDHYEKLFTDVMQRDAPE